MSNPSITREKKVLVVVGLLAAAANASCGGPPDSSSGTNPEFRVAAQSLVGSNVLKPTKDTSLVGGLLGNLPLGTLPFLLVERAPVAFDQRAMQLPSLSGMQITSARLEFNIVGNPILAGRSRNIQLHRLTRDWSEESATFRCADDDMPFNLRADCPAGQGWFVGTPPPAGKSNPWAATPTATAQLRPRDTGVLAFDVTADVNAFVAGTLPNYGWIIKSDDLNGGLLILASRETSLPPRLLLTTGCAGGYADCDVNPANGCERPLNTVINCGACGNACDDNNPCTADSCGADGRCAHTAVHNGTACDDGNACTLADSCQAGVCTGSNPVTCVAADQCHVAGVCNTLSGLCSNPPVDDGTACNDGDACTLADSCQAGACVGATPITCVSTDQCHVAGVCDPQTGACNNPAVADGTACNDDNACTQTDSCQAGACTGASPVTCVAVDQCHAAGTCDPQSGSCSNPAVADGTVCNDGNACTRLDSCQAGACAGASPVTCAATDQCHAAGVCDPQSGACTNPAVADGTACNDGKACTRNDRCLAGACAASDPVVCASADGCHPGVCDEASGACKTVVACQLYGVGTMSSSLTDGLAVSPQTLEDGTSNNAVGGTGSAITYTGVGNQFLVAPDRGPNAGDDSYTERYYVLDLGLGDGKVLPTLRAGAVLDAGAGLPAFTGRNTLFDATNSPASRRLDVEGLRAGADGTFYVSDEYGPFVYQFSADGHRLRALNVPAKFLIDHPAIEDDELPPTNTKGRQANAGMEGLAISPDGSKLYGLMQRPLIQDGALSSKNNRVGTNLRLLEMDTVSGGTREFLYPLDNANLGTNEIVAVNDHQFLVDERDGKDGNGAAFKRLMLIDISNATDISNIASLPSTAIPAGVTPVSKKLFLDLLDPAFGLAGKTFPEKIEGLAFGPDLPDGRHTLVVTSDNDFIAGNDGKLYVFTIDPQALPGYVAQQVNFTDACDAGGTTVTCSAADVCHRAGMCNPGSGTCSQPFEPAGKPVDPQVAGDCRRTQCDGAGQVVSAFDAADIQNDGNVCTADLCSPDGPAHVATAAGTSCNQNGGSLCDGAGSCVACLTAADCGGSDTECAASTCIAGSCGRSFAPVGTPVSAQTAGDCQRVQCDGAGGLASAADDADLPTDDGNPCTQEICAGGAPAAVASPAGTMCGGNGLCDGAGSCLGCLTASDCPGVDSECAQRTCTAGVCGVAAATFGTPVASQTASDCQLAVCDGTGSVMALVDDTDVPNDANVCTADLCLAGVPAHNNLPAGIACGQGSTCDGSGQCVAAPTFRVLRVGDGTVALGSVGASVFIDERRLDGSLVGTVALPAVQSGANLPFTQSGSASSEGSMSLSGDGRYLITAGYAAAPGTAGVASATAATIKRSVARIDALGNVDTSTTLTTAFNANNVRSATSADGTGFWVGGAGGATGGVWWVPVGTSGGVQVMSSLNNVRWMHVIGGQLYGTSNQTGTANVFTIGAGLPIVGGQNAKALGGMPSNNNPSPFSFVLFDLVPGVGDVATGGAMDTMYVADDRAATASNGGVQKWTWNGTTWVQSPNLNLVSGAIGYRGLAGTVSGGKVTLMASSADSTNTRLVVFVDNGGVVTSSVVFTAPANVLYRGVTLSPRP